MRQIVKDVKLTVALGLIMGAVYSACALFIFLVRGNAPFEHLHVSLLGSIAMYLLAGLLAGLVFGLLLPLTRWVVGAALVSFIAAFVVWFVIGRSISDGERLIDTVKMSAVLGAAFGLPIGVGFWYQGRRYERTGKWS
jgi:hypothetical protein